MKSSANRVEILLVDYRPQQDLMFWDALSRSVAKAHRDGRRMCLVVGCDEKVERLLLQNGLDIERSERDELRITKEISDEMEKLVREEKKSITSRLTDEGVAAVGMMGFERGLFRSVDGEIVAKKAIGSGLWQAPMVVPIVMSVCREESGLLRDVHPITLASALAQNMTDEVSISVLSQRVTGKFSLAESEEGRDQLSGLLASNRVSKLIENLSDLSIWSISGPSLPSDS